jgi:hypothetical protein
MNDLATGMDEETSEVRPFIAVEKSVSDGLSESSEIVQNNLGRGVELIPSLGFQVPTEDRGEIEAGPKTSGHKKPLRPQASNRLSKGMQRRGAERERQVIQDAVD